MHSPATSGQAAATTGLIVRDRRFAPGAAGSDPVARAWLVALSASFPRGEAMFIEAVKANARDAPPALAAQIRDFIRQEVNHSREHLAFNRMASDAGLDLAAIDARVAALVAMTMNKPPVVRLAVTCALEHFTAIFAREFLTHPERHLPASAGRADQALWEWHSVEEIEHKAVAFDTLHHATRHWNGARRWRLRALVMAGVSLRFLANRWRDAIELLAQQGIGGLRARLLLARYLWLNPGMLRRIAPAWAAWFRPGFHPAEHDDGALIAAYDARQNSEGARTADHWAAARAPEIA